MKCESDRVATCTKPGPAVPVLAQGRPRHFRDRRSRLCRGFTLIELLMVVVIIGILAALLLPVIGGAMRRARITQVSTDINLLETGLTQFKSKYGVFPPSRIHLHEVADSNGNGILDYNEAIHNDVVLDAVDIRTVQFLKRLWPNFNLNQNWDWNGSGTASTTEPGMILGGIDLNGSECLVFFLGGMPQLSPGNVRSVEGFSTNPQFPFSRPTNDGNILLLIPGYDQRTQRLFEFDSGRLTDIDGDFYWEYYDPYQEPPQLTGVGQFDPDVMPHPYAYFSAYDGQGYNWLRLPAAQPVLTFDNMWFDAANNPRGLFWPFSRNVGLASQVQWFNEDSYQLISPGIDGLIGTSILLSNGQDDNNNGQTDEPAEGFMVLNPDATPPLNTLSDQAMDNITNFSGGQLEDMQ